ncbi:hypothetical protein [Vulcanisaeta sp. JCM 16159]|uniref:hypothetical protein n=1 Tax=Vulcanisaeta sp. JCM 16159 TaxID=1295371 RepID=UPI0006D1D076|nr:hypothetical protein [Vulcanisaeta sp. JCM 16159]
MWAGWRVRLLRKLDIVLIIFELVLSVMLLLTSYITKSPYLRGVGVGLMIAWVTSAIAYAVRTKGPWN